MVGMIHMNSGGTKIAIITDTHHGIRGDAGWMLDYQEKFYKEFFFPELKRQGIKTIFHAGDLFDRRKYVNFVTLYRTRKMFFDILRKEGIEMYIIPGNHDVAHKSDNSVNSLSTLLNEYSNVKVFDESPETITIDNVSFDFIPWIHNGNYAETLDFISKSDSEIAVGHLELAGFEMYRGSKNEHGMDAKLFDRYSQVWTGHFHHKSSKGNIHYLGAPMEFTWGDYDDPRGFHIFDCESKELTFYKNPFTLYEKIFYNDELDSSVNRYKEFNPSSLEDKIVKVFVSRKTKPALFEYFVDMLYNASLLNLTVIEDYSEFHESNIEDEKISTISTKDLMLSYIETVETDLDKSRITTILENLYVEAQTSGTLAE